MGPTMENAVLTRDENLEKRPKLRRIKKKAKLDLNISNNNRVFKSLSSRMNMSISAANSSVVKASLRANNKALAQSLEKAQLDLRVSYELNNDLKKESQDLQLRVHSLERVAGLKDESLEREVQLRMEDKMNRLKQILSLVSVHLLDAGSSLQDALDKCVDPASLSLNTTARNSSVGLMDDVYSPLAAASSIYCKPKPTSVPLTVGRLLPSMGDVVLPSMGYVVLPGMGDVVLPGMGDVVLPGMGDVVLPDTDDVLLSVPQEMTMILEQSVLPDTEEALCPLSDVLPAVSESEDQTTTDAATTSICSTNRGDKGTAQRMKRCSCTFKKCDDKKVASPARGEAFSISDAVDKQNRRETFVIPTLVCKEDKKDAKARRETFIVAKSHGEDYKSCDYSNHSAQAQSPKCDTLVFKTPHPVDEHVTDMVEDVTSYLNTDMEMTEIIPTELIKAAWKDDSLDAELLKKDNTDVAEDHQNKDAEKHQRQKSRIAIAKSVSMTAISSRKEKDVQLSKSDGDVRKESDNASKPAVVLHLRKPGNIVFTASRREIDGSRKAITSSKPRSKSKKQIRVLKESIAADTSEPRTIFDFHDKTPAHLTEKSRLDASVPPDDPHKEMESAERDANIVIYNLPLKDSPVTRTSPKGRTTRSKSRTRAADIAGAAGTDDVEIRRRSKSRSRSKAQDTDGVTSRNDRGRSKSRKPRTQTSKEPTERVGVDEHLKERPDGVEKKKDIRASGDILTLEASDRKTSMKASSGDIDEDYKVPCSKGKSLSLMNSKPNRDQAEENKPLSRSDNQPSSYEPDEKRTVPTCKAKDKNNGGAPCTVEVGKATQQDTRLTTDKVSSKPVPSEKRMQRAAKTKALSKNMCEAMSDDEGEPPQQTDAEVDQSWQNNVLLNSDILDVTGDLAPINSRDFISRLSSAKPKLSEYADSDDSKEEIGRTRKNRIRGKILISESDDEQQDENIVQSDRQISGQKDITIALSCQAVSGGQQSAKTTRDAVLITPDLSHKASEVAQARGRTSPRVSGAKPTDIVERRMSPCKKQAQKVDMVRIGNRKRENVQDILQAFTDFDDPDHSLHLNAILRNDSIVIAEAIKNTCHDVTHATQSLEALEEAGREDMYSLPLKDSPTQSRATGRARSQPRARKARSKKRLPASVSDDDENYDINSRAGGEQVYSLPLKESPTEKEVSKIRSDRKSATRSRSRSKKRTVIPDSDEDFQIAKCKTASKAKSKNDSHNDDTKQVQSNEDDQHATVDVIYSMPLKDSSVNSRNVTSRARSKSRSRTSEKRHSQKAQSEKLSESNDNGEVLKIPIEVDNPDARDVGTTRAKSDASATVIQGELADCPPECSSSTSSPKTLTKKKGVGHSTKKDQTRETRQDQLNMLRVRFSELKEQSQMSLPAAGMATGQKENWSSLKRKMDDVEVQNDEACEKRSRRTAAGVNYKEFSLGSKLRRGDPGTSHFFVSEPLRIFKSS